ncbi:TPA: 30S ribosomal protein S17 [Candidatus Woesearchaeota archaeon]|nr:30S ribosomal protein S17P [uncultured archaeon]HIH31490.1 30S ribosomal protein S17 [Candidatus Woesearchaeota archaeon]HIJ13879.1 30S ribosomal protein S17 [Candidatus Woesearchaeota archaeon]
MKNTNSAKNIGIEAKNPEKSKNHDPKDPFFGSLKVRGRIFTGTVISDKMMKTATVEWPRRKYSRKYERFEVRRSRVKAHNPESINAKQGDIVRIVETRPLSKTKHFVIIEIVTKKSG